MQRLSGSLKNIIIIITLALSVTVTGGALLCNNSFNQHNGFLINELGWTGVIIFIGSFELFSCTSLLCFIFLKN